MCPVGELSGTRRNKRKGDDVDISPARAAKQHPPRQQNGASSSARSTPRTGTKPKKTRRPPNSSPTSASKRSLSEKDKSTVSKLKKKAKISAKQAVDSYAQHDDNQPSSPIDDDEPRDRRRSTPRAIKRAVRSSKKSVQPVHEQDDDDVSPLRGRRRRGNESMPGSQRKTRSKSPVRQSSDEDEDEYEEQERSDIAQEDDDEEEEESDDEEDGDGDAVANSARKVDDPTPIHLGESDDEQEVSINIGDTDKYDDAEKRRTSLPTDGAPSKDVELSETPSASTQPIAGSNQIHMNASLLRGLSQTGGLDISVLLNVVQELKTAIMVDIGRSIDQVMKEIRRDRDSIQKLQHNISELASVITTTASALFIKQPSTQPRMREIQNKLCLLPALFNTKFMLKVLPRVVIGFFVNHIVDGSPYGELESNGIELLSTLNFSIQPYERKTEKYATERGKLYAKFRHSLLLSSFLAMQANSFSTFRNDKDSVDTLNPSDINDAEETSPVAPSLGAGAQPFWLKHGYVGSEHCKSAAKTQQQRKGCGEIEESQSSQLELGSQTTNDADSVDVNESSQSSGKKKVVRSGPLTHNEIATEAASMLYREFTSLLRRSRQCCKTQLFHDVMYLFVGWNQYEVPVNQNTLKVHWEIARLTDVDYIDNLSRTKVIKPNERQLNIRQDNDAIDLHNNTHLQTLISLHPELSLIVEHDVFVKGNACRLRYRISLIEVACRTLASYTTLESAARGHEILSTDKRCLKSIVVLGIGLRKLMECAIDDLNSSTSIPWYHNRSTKSKTSAQQRRLLATSPPPATYSFTKVNGVCLDQFQTSPSKQKELLHSMILNLTEEEFQAKSMRSTNEGTPAGLGDRERDDIRITADESNGVFAFS